MTPIQHRVILNAAFTLVERKGLLNYNINDIKRVSRPYTMSSHRKPKIGNDTINNIGILYGNLVEGISTHALEASFFFKSSKFQLSSSATY